MGIEHYTKNIEIILILFDIISFYLMLSIPRFFLS